MRYQDAEKFVKDLTGNLAMASRELAADSAASSHGKLFTSSGRSARAAATPNSAPGAKC